MDAGGVDVHVLSMISSGVQNLEPAQSVKIARATNDFLAETVKNQPDRFEAFAALPTPDGSRARVGTSRYGTEMERAKPLEHNKFKVELGRRAVVRALRRAANGGAA